MGVVVVGGGGGGGVGCSGGSVGCFNTGLAGQASSLHTTLLHREVGPT